MITLRKKLKAYLINNYIDMSKSIDGLPGLVLEEFDNPTSEHLFIFFYKAKDKIKIFGGYIYRLQRARHAHLACGDIISYQGLEIF